MTPAPTRRRFTAAIAAAGVFFAVAAAPGHAQAQADQATIETVAADATSTGITINVFGNELATSNAAAHLDMIVDGETVTGTSTADAVGQATVADTAASATTGVGGDAASDGPNCGLDLAALPVVGDGVACGEASTTFADTNPTAAATGSIAPLTVDGGDATGLVDLSDTVADGVTTVGDTLESLFGDLGDLGIDPVTGTVDDVLDALAGSISSADDTVTVTVAAATAAVTATDDTVVAAGNGNAVTIEVLPGAVGGPIAVIDVAASDASATFDRVTGISSGEVTAAVATITLAPTIADALGVDTTIPLDLDTGECVLPDPLTICVAVTDSNVAVDDDGAAVAGSVIEVSVLSGISGGVSVTVPAATAAVAGTITDAPTTTTTAPPTTSAPPTSVADPQLPKTGSGIPGAAFAAAAAGAVALAARRRVR